MDDRLITLQGLYGDGKVTIAKSCLKFVADRKIFSGGVMYLNLQGVTSCLTFLKKFRQLILNRMNFSDEKF